MTVPRSLCPGRSTPRASQCCGSSITALAPKAELLLSGPLWEKVLLASDLRSKSRQSWSFKCCRGETARVLPISSRSASKNQASGEDAPEIVRLDW